MKSRNLFTILFVLLAITLTFSVAAAEKFEVIPIPISYDFLVSTAPSTTACQCSETSFPVSITNTGSYTTIFTITSDDNKVVFSQPTITLQPGEHRQVIASRSVPCTLSGTSDVSIFVTSSFHFTKEVKSTFVFSDCQNTKFAFDKVNLNASVCKPFDTTLFITNDGGFTETYTIKPLDRIVILSAGSVTLPAGQTASIQARYTLPCDVYGVYDLEYKIDASKAQKSYKVKQTVSIPYEYDFDLRTVQDINFCAQDSTVLVLELENKNNFTNDFKFDIDVPKYATVDFPEVNGEKIEVFSVDAHTIIPINITLDPEKKDVGTKEITIEVTDKYGDITKSLTVNVTTNNCYDLSTAFWLPKKQVVCGGDYQQIPFTLLNNGDDEGSFILDAQGIEYVFFENTSYVVPAHSEKEVMLTIDMFNNIWGEFPITLNTYDVDGTLVDAHEFTLVSQPKEFCYQIQPKKSVYKVRYDKDIVSIALKNTGTRNGNYFVDLQSENDTLEAFPQMVSVDSGKSLWLGVNNTINRSIGSQEHITLTLVEKESSASYTYPITIIFSDYSVLTRTFWSVYDTIYYTNNCVLVSLALLLAILIFVGIVLCRSYKNKSYKTPKNLLLVLVLVIIVAAAAVYSFKGLPFVYTSYDLETNSTTHLLLEEDTLLSLDLSGYFFDPDGDIVEYGVSSIDAEVLLHEVDNATLTLTPAPDYFGETMLMLYATDAYGLTAESRKIRVDVLPVEDYTLSELYGLLCVYCNWLLLVILSFFIFLTFAYKQAPKEKQKKLSEVIVVRSEDSVKVVSSNKKASKKSSSKKTVSKKSSAKKSTKKVSKKASKKSSSDKK